MIPPIGSEMWDDGTIWTGAQQGKLLLKACRQCAAICHPPLPMCPRCQSLDWDSRAAAGRAKLKSWLVSIRPDRLDDTQRIVIVAELQEGARFVSNLIGASLADLREDMPLEICFEKQGDIDLPLFRPPAAAPDDAA